MFVALEPRRLYRQVADQIRALIAAGELVVGQRLPAERDLAERFGVSRPTVREALIVLEVEGYIQIRMGSGVYIAKRPAAVPVTLPADEVDGPFEILQARCIVESAIAEEAARHASPEGIAQLDEMLARMEASFEQPERAIAADLAFHAAIADMIGNAALHHVISLLIDKRTSPYFEKLASYFEGPHTWQRAAEEHKAIRDAIAAGDPPAAREAMRRHLTLAQKRFSESFGEELAGED
ncbi:MULTISPECIES: FadR/GntR family transcriptional regulator [Alphaproteobacteria]|uniref:GntR family transcriptional regulator n=2 Tax=Alphaproteobacteria TaxID=28211 RepID=A0A512HHB5_9HYPH|nr:MULTISPECIES: FadR/GntR family transcriptional regulator [Alphaproteobacteria]GEO84841.1 GntR family transcriptional regulator [Ciceribacter naphthalenivorans]GLR20538.1 GntR family transcriptional regulator [Ciceribacter naphthalenivorans]GLT03394.1 GntR family transcriptional regulator [Sphingomonas psychrolutea]